MNVMTLAGITMVSSIHNVTEFRQHQHQKRIQSPSHQWWQLCWRVHLSSLCVNMWISQSLWWRTIYDPYFAFTMSVYITKKRKLEAEGHVSRRKWKDADILLCK